MTNPEFDIAMKAICRGTDPAKVHSEGLRIIGKTLGDNILNCIPGIDLWCRTVRRLSTGSTARGPVAYVGDSIHPDTVARKAGVP